MQEKRNCQSRFTRSITRVILRRSLRQPVKNAIMRCLHGGTVAFPACIPYVRPGYCLTPSSTCRATWSVTWTRYYSSRVARSESSHDEGTLRSRSASEALMPRYTILPNMMDRDDTRSVKGAERLVRMYMAPRGTFVHFRGICEDTAVIRPNSRCNSSNTANYRIDWGPRIEMRYVSN